VADEFYAFYAFHAIIEPVSYGRMEGLKVQVPPPASGKSFNNNRSYRHFSVVSMKLPTEYNDLRLGRGGDGASSLILKKLTITWSKLWGETQFPGGPA
jgi:hypothetical protein